MPPRFCPEAPRRWRAASGVLPTNSWRDRPRLSIAPRPRSIRAPIDSTSRSDRDRSRLAHHLHYGCGMSHLTAITRIDTYAPPVDRRRQNYRHIRVLRWTFRRDDEAVVCELALTGEDREYELRVPADWNPTGRPIERFDDALTAFQRHAMIERTLLDAGWQLDGFESEKVTLH